MMPVNPRFFARLALMSAAAAAFAACAHAPPPPAETASTPPPPPPPPQTSSGAPIGERSTGPIPGSEQDFVINVGDRVYFDTDQYSVRADGATTLSRQAEWLSRYPRVAIRIEGSCDDRGTREYNLALGARRADAVKTYLVGRGIDAGRITTISYGKEKPMDPGTGDEAWSHNRNAHTALTSGAMQ